MANRKALARVLGKKAVAALSALDLRKLEAAFAESDTPVKDEDELAAEEDEEDQIAAEEDDDDLTDAEKDEDDQTIAEKDDDDLMDAEEDEEDVNPKVAKAILDLNSAIGRRTLAQKLAFSPGMSVRQANSFLRAAPKATKASRLASKMNGVLAIGKQAFYEQARMPLADAYAHTGEVITANMMMRDTEEGIAAFLEKRAPDWKA